MPGTIFVFLCFYLKCLEQTLEKVLKHWHLDLNCYRENEDQGGEFFSGRNQMWRLDQPTHFTSQISLISDHITLCLNRVKKSDKLYWCVIIGCGFLIRWPFGNPFKDHSGLSKAIHRAFVLCRGSNCAEREDGKQIDRPKGMPWCPNDSTRNRGEERSRCYNKTDFTFKRCSFQHNTQYLWIQWLITPALNI